MTRRVSLALAVVCALAAVTKGAFAAPQAAADRELAYRVGPGDVLEVTVPGRPDLSRLPTVQPTGTIFMPVVGEVPVAELTVAEAAKRLSTLLGKEGLPTPVQVRVREFQSRSVFVAGQVVRPGRKPLRANSRLIDILTDAGGFSAAASGEVVVQRRDGTFEDGTTVRRYRFTAQGPTDEERANISLLLEPGDVVTARAREYVLVKGEVERPGQYLLDEGMTVTKALEAAGGLTRFGHPKVSLERARPAEGEPARLEVDTRAVRAGESPDPTLRPDDALSVRARKI